MLGLVVLFAILLYLFISGLAVWLAVVLARKLGFRGWIPGCLVALVMYNLVFWDLIPTLLVHRYYCINEAGFWVYKAPDQWAEDNPDSYRSLSITHLPEEYKTKTEMMSSGGTVKYILPDGSHLSARYGYDHKTKSIVLNGVDIDTDDGWQGLWLNERFRSLWKRTNNYPFSISRTEWKLVDSFDNTVLVKDVQFNWGRSNALSLGPSEPIRGLGTAYLAGGGGCGASDFLSFLKHANFFRDKNRFPYKEN